MFDLEQEIRHWRKAIAARMRLQTNSIAELESHLRDAVQKHVQSGLTVQDAWKESLKQLGDLEVDRLRSTECAVVAIVCRRLLIHCELFTRRIRLLQSCQQTV